MTFEPIIPPPPCQLVVRFEFSPIFPVILYLLENPTSPFSHQPHTVTRPAVIPNIFRLPFFFAALFPVSNACRCSETEPCKFFWFLAACLLPSGHVCLRWLPTCCWPISCLLTNKTCFVTLLPPTSLAPGPRSTTVNSASVFIWALIFPKGNATASVLFWVPSIRWLHRFVYVAVTAAYSEEARWPASSCPVPPADWFSIFS